MRGGASAMVVGAPNTTGRRQRRKQRGPPCYWQQLLQQHRPLRMMGLPRAGACGMLLLLAGQARVPVAGACPNACSGHGHCLSSNPFDCICDNGWRGPDCRERVCPLWMPWGGTPTADDEVHTWENRAECANMGQCDRATGRCQCEDGFSGHACQIMDCPKDAHGRVCGGNGRCVSMDAAAAERDLASLFHETSYGAWDAQMIYGCVCDEPYAGFDCSVRQCPFGDDPLTLGQYNEVQVLDCVCDADPCDDSVITLAFRGVATAAVSANGTLANLEAALDALRTLNGGVDAAISGDTDGSSAFCSAAGVSTAVTFTHNAGDLVELLPSTTAGSAALAVQSGGAVGLFDGTLASRDGTTEYAECSGRGLCDRSTGHCNCFADFGSSDGAGGPGYRGDCGYIDSDNVTLDAVKHCPRADLYWDLPMRSYEVPHWGDVCSGHGTCGYSSSFVCQCQEGYTGRYCQRMACAEGAHAWFDEATAEDTAHASGFECSNRGACNGDEGVCTCAPGFEGQACQRLQCGGGPRSNCGGHGRCLTQADFAAYAEDDDGKPSGYSYATPWDAEMVQVCDCDQGYNSDWRHSEGYMCGSVDCPLGRDPHDEQGADEVQVVTCSHTAGSFALRLGLTTSDVINVDDGLDAIAAALEDFGVEVDFTSDAFNTACDAGYTDGHGIELTFVARYGDVDLVELRSAYSLEGGNITVSEVSAGTTVGYECSNRGVCDRATGECKCFPGYCSSDGARDLGLGLRGDCTFRDLMCQGRA